MQGACERTTPDKLNNCMLFGGKHVSHFYAAIGEGSTKPQEKLLETIGATEDHTGGNVNHFAVLGNILSGIVEPVRIRLVSVVGIIPSPNESHNLLCSHDNFLSRESILPHLHRWTTTERQRCWQQNDKLHGKRGNHQVVYLKNATNATNEQYI